ncbi:MAG TPA: hypothetical protein EYM52_13275, partial [Dehalococcoidia bacterium]|nr:hypothetical protein [Dehalococcoidia bacterium]
GLSEVVRLTPGEHTLKLHVDPHNLIDESDETNNSYEVTFMWDSGEASALASSWSSRPTVAAESRSRPEVRLGWRVDRFEPPGYFQG